MTQRFLGLVRRLRLTRLSSAAEVALNRVASAWSHWCCRFFLQLTDLVWGGGGYPRVPRVCL